MAQLLRLQDTRASVAAKINRILAGHNVRLFRPVPQTDDQWRYQLNAAVRELNAANYQFGDEPLVFRVSDTDTAFLKKLHRLQAVIVAGNA